MRKKGFTLIELLVVIAIIALLMAILVPTLQRVKRQAKAVVCQSRLDQWGLIYATYAFDPDHTDRRDWDPEVPFWVPLQVETGEGVEMGSSYRDCDDLLLCPMATKPVPIPEPVSKPDLPHVPYGTTFKAWRFGWPREVVGSYGITHHLWYAQHSGAPYWETWFVKGASSVPFIFDCRYIFGGTLYSTTQPPSYEDMPLPPGVLDVYSVCMNRHNGGINCLFMDFSVRKVGLKELWALKWHRQFDTGGPWTKAGGVQPEDWPEWMRRFKDY